MILANNVKTALKFELFQKMTNSIAKEDGYEEKVAADLAAKTDQELYDLAIQHGLLKPLEIK